jgi:hypothetical protein
MSTFKFLLAIAPYCLMNLPKLVLSHHVYRIMKVEIKWPCFRDDVTV